ncbi:MAG TPA: hypothetical protein VFV58_23875 [Blastocatellia bacterium]|jgi:hypothetical protein|nr:hypothetical protein [Blastocatellia bacterium]
MATNFTVIQFQRQHFGNEPGVFNDIEPDVPFAGSTKDFAFDCPGINPSETAFLMFQSRDVDHQRNIFQINGVDVFGGLPASPARDAWNGNILLVEPRHQLRATGNTLHVESRNFRGGRGLDIDDFIIDNVVIMYKIPDFSLPLPAATGDFAVFLTKELLPSIPNVRGSGRGANRADQLNQYVLPTASQLASWRAVFQSLLAGAWGPAHRLARRISSTYNVVQFLDTPTGRTYFVLMEGVPGQIPDPVDHISGVPITDPADHTRRGWGAYVFAAQPQRALSFSAPHPHDDLETEVEAVEAFLSLGAHTLLIAGADRDQNTAEARCEQSSRPYLEADVSHTAESVFQMAFEEIYSSDASTWHLQFHGNANTTLACRDVDVFLSNGVEAAPSTLYTLGANIAAASIAAAAGGPVLVVDVYDAPGDCELRGTDNMQMRFASGLPHESICAPGNDPVGPSRFIHVEQRIDARRAPNDVTPGRNRGVVLAGILATFP